MVLSLLDPAPPEGPVRVAALPLVNVRFRKALVRLRFSFSGRISPSFSKETGFGMSDVGLAGSKRLSPRLKIWTCGVDVAAAN